MQVFFRQLLVNSEINHIISRTENRKASLFELLYLVDWQFKGIPYLIKTLTQENRSCVLVLKLFDNKILNLINYLLKNNKFLIIIDLKTFE